jgi:hypothetical protein
MKIEISKKNLITYGIMAAMAVALIVLALVYLLPKNAADNNASNVEIAVRGLDGEITIRTELALEFTVTGGEYAFVGGGIYDETGNIYIFLTAAAKEDNLDVYFYEIVFYGAGTYTYKFEVDDKNGVRVTVTDSFIVTP